MFGKVSCMTAVKLPSKGPVYSGLCSRCGKIFYCRWNPQRPPRYCSTNCQHLSRHRRIILQCPICRKSFMRRNCTFAQSKRHFCSQNCWRAFHKGKNCHTWKRGFWIGKQGYKITSINGRKVAEHIVVMEKIIGRRMKGRGKEVVHHIDGNKLNNNPKNLRLMSTPDHQRMHATKHH